MPNHVENDLTIKGTREQLENFKAKMNNTNWQGDKVLLNEDVLIPYPQHFKDMDNLAREWYKKNAIDGVYLGKLKEGVNPNDRPKDGFNSGGYEWCIKNWGTKWGFYDVSITKETDTSITYTFKTAWSPSIPLIHKMGIMFKDLDITLRYYERGMEFKGVYHIWNGGSCISTTQSPYKGTRGG
jgi:hypothetical protein